MREFKFRGRKSNGEWVCGYYVGKDTIIPFGNVNFDLGFIDTSPCYEVIPGTIGQFTGLHDKNGKEIYEGDILFVREWKNLAMGMFDHEEREQFSLEDCKGELLYESQRVVYFEEGSMCAGDYYISALWDKQDKRHQYPIFEVEVIGNIHDNPELLNEKK